MQSHDDIADRDDQKDGLSRRWFLGMIGAGGCAAFLAGCNNASTASAPDSMTAPVPATSLDDGFAPPTPTRPLPPPPVAREPKNPYGILPRSMWARGGPDLKRIQPMGGVRLITFHHSGDPKPFLTSDFGETAQHLEYVREYHRSRNFQDIGYHFGIDRAGRVWQLRSLLYEGQHVRHNNPHNIGVVVLGNFDLQTMTQAQKNKVINFGALLRKKYVLPISRVYTHQEIVATKCPGRAMQPYMVAIRRQKLI